MTYSLDRARADHEAGRLWKARDRLHGLLRDRQDEELLDLLATVHLEMGDLPAAGALWFVTGRADESADLAIRAWRERRGSEEARWASIPGPVRHGKLAGHLEELRRAAQLEATQPRPVGDGPVSRPPVPWRASDALEPLVLWSITLALLGLLGIGFWTVVRWIFG